MNCGTSFLQIFLELAAVLFCYPFYFPHQTSNRRARHSRLTHFERLISTNRQAFLYILDDIVHRPTFGYAVEHPVLF